MTLRTNARIAGLAFLLYIAFGIASMVLFGEATRAEGIAGKLARMAEHESEARLAAVLTLLCGFCALALGVTLYAITREVDRDLAMLGLVFRAGEGVLAGLSVQGSLALVWLATVRGAGAPGAEGAHALGAYLLRGQGPAVSATFFAAGSLAFCWLLLRGRMIPAALAWLGVVASALWVVGFPLQVAGVVGGPATTWLLYLPMAAFEITFALWLIFKGVAPPRAPTTS